VVIGPRHHGEEDVRAGSSPRLVRFSNRLRKPPSADAMYESSLVTR
jgi:hypothetical protein